MPTRPIAESIEIRRLIKDALDSGKDTPSDVIEYIARHSEIVPPTPSTVGKIMNDNGYYPKDSRWVKKG